MALLLLAAACGGSGTTPTGEKLVAEAQIGPAGGVLLVGSGALSGMSLQVPPGALAVTQTLRAVEVGYLLTSVVPPAGPRVRLEPVALEFALPATLRLPYHPAAIRNTAPGNVRAQLTSPRGERLLVPSAVDVAGGRADFAVEGLGTCLVVTGPAAELTDYLPTDSQLVTFDSGATFLSQLLLDEPNLPAGTTRWTIDTGDGPRGLYLIDGQFLYDVAGRFDLRGQSGGWQEIWNFPKRLFAEPLVGPPGNFFADGTSLFAPYGSTLQTGSGRARLTSGWSGRQPLQLGGSLLLDVLELQLQVQWTHDASPFAAEQLTLWLAPGLGVVGMLQDGVTHLRSGS